MAKGCSKRFMKTYETPPLSLPPPCRRLPRMRRDQMDIPEDDAQKMVSVKDAVEYIAENK